MIIFNFCNEDKEATAYVWGKLSMHYPEKFDESYMRDKIDSFNKHNDRQQILNMKNTNNKAGNFFEGFAAKATNAAGSTFAIIIAFFSPDLLQFC